VGWIDEESIFAYGEPEGYNLSPTTFPRVTVCYDDHHGQRWKRKPSGELVHGDPAERPTAEQPGRVPKPQ